MTLSKRLFLLGVVSLAGCSGTREWSQKLMDVDLYRRAGSAFHAKGCMDKIPMEYGHTYPIPSRAAGIANFVIEYYPRGFTNALGPYDLHEPEWSQTFGVTGSSASACVQLHAFGTTKVLGVQNTSERPGSAKDDFILWRDLESLSKHYFSGDHLDHAGQGTAVEFLDDFQKLAQPGFLPVYYRMSPGFWEWLRTETGRSIPAA